MKCQAQLHIADDYGDNEATMNCQLEQSHVGLHQERYGKSSEDFVLILWTRDCRTTEAEQALEHVED